MDYLFKYCNKLTILPEIQKIYNKSENKRMDNIKSLDSKNDNDDLLLFDKLIFNKFEEEKNNNNKSEEDSFSFSSDNNELISNLINENKPQNMNILQFDNTSIRNEYFNYNKKEEYNDNYYENFYK